MWKTLPQNPSWGRCVQNQFPHIRSGIAFSYFIEVKGDNVFVPNISPGISVCFKALIVSSEIYRTPINQRQLKIMPR